MHTLGTAAKATGLNKSTVLRAIKSGKISAAKDEHGEWQIDAATAAATGLALRSGGGFFAASHFPFT